MIVALRVCYPELVNTRRSSPTLLLAIRALHFAPILTTNRLNVFHALLCTLTKNLLIIFWQLLT